MALKLRRRIRTFTNVSLSLRNSVCQPDSLRTGAASFKRVLGGTEEYGGLLSGQTKLQGLRRHPGKLQLKPPEVEDSSIGCVPATMVNDVVHCPQHTPTDRLPDN